MDEALQKRITETAHWLLDMRVSIMPIDMTSKKPAIEWKALIDEPMAKESWLFTDCNIGLITGMTSNYVVVDCDSTDDYLGWLKHMPATRLRVKTKRGMHFYYRSPGTYIKSDSHIKHEAGFEYDVKGDRSYVLFPPSMRSGHQYQITPCNGNPQGEFCGPELLPEFDPAWRPERAGTAGYNDKAITDGVAYISQIRAVGKERGGQGRDKDTFRAACKLIESGLGEMEALAALIQWNQTNVDPPEQISVLIHKVRSALAETKQLQTSEG